MAQNLYTNLIVNGLSSDTQSLVVKTGTTDIFAINYNGTGGAINNFGIGTLSPSYKLHLIGATTGFSTTSVYFSNSASTRSWTLDDDGTVTQTGRLLINYANTFGTEAFNISAPSFSNIVSVDGGTNGRVNFANGEVQINYNGHVGINTAPGSSANLYIVGDNSSSSDYTLFTNNSSSQGCFVVRNDGRVGINTTSPRARLDLSFSGQSIISGPNANTSSGYKYILEAEDNNGFVLGYNTVTGNDSRYQLDVFTNGSRFYIYDNNLTSGNHIKLDTRGSSNHTYFYLTGNTNFGINTTSPSAKLHTKGNTGLFIESDDAGYGSFKFRPYSSQQNYSSIQSSDGDELRWGGALGSPLSNGEFAFYNTANTNVKLAINHLNPTANLNVKGSRTDTASKPFRLENSASTFVYDVYDNGAWEWTTFDNIYPQFKTTGSIFQMNWDAGSQLYHIYKIGSVAKSTFFVNTNLSYWQQQANIDWGIIDANSNAQFWFDEDVRRIGIGTQTPSSKLHVVGNRADTATNGLVVQNSAGTSSLTIRDDAKVAIGATPAYNQTFNVNGTSYFDNAVYIQSEGLISYSPGANFSINASSNDLLLRTLASKPVIIAPGGSGFGYFVDTSGGRFGLGTSSPSERLHVSGGTIRINTSNGSEGAGKFAISDANGSISFSSTTDLGLSTSSGTVGGTGTAGYIAKWNSTTGLTNSLLSETGTGVTVMGSVYIYGNVDVLGTATTFNTQTIQTADNNITLNLSGSHVSSYGGGITVLSGRADNVSSTWNIDAIGAWSANTPGNFTGLRTDSTGYTLRTYNSAGTNTFIVKDNGYVGVGTSSPAAFLDVTSTGTSYSNFIFKFTNGAATTKFHMYDNGETYFDPSSGFQTVKHVGGRWDFPNTLSIGGLTVVAGDILTVKGTDSSTTNYAIKSINSSGLPLIFARNDGNVGVGTTLPAEKLHVSGGTIRINTVNGTEGAGKLAVSDANGSISFSSTTALGLGAGSVNKYSTSLTTPGASVTNTITHNLGTTDITVTLWLVSTGDMTSAKITNRQTNSVDVIFASAPGENVRVVVTG